ncbi:S24 family peptidase (plasmid) [Streptomyces anulatus]|nr:S24 family peptidase [Streptomyces anulatus]WTF66907.1 S24 family peptidase [Streptomyces anulatus]
MRVVRGLVTVEKIASADHGDIVAVILDHKATLKQLS